VAFEMRNRLSKRDKVLLGVIALAVSAFAYYYFVYNPITAQISAQKSRNEELGRKIEAAKIDSGALEEKITSELELMDNTNEIISTYYPYIEPQYFVDLLRVFSDELNLTISSIDVESPTLQNLSHLIPDEKEKTNDDPFLSTLEEIVELSEDSQKSTSASEDNQSSDTGSSSGGNSSSDNKSSSGGSASGDKSAGDTEQDPIKPGTIILNHLSFTIINGSFEQYLSFLNKINSTGYPIYVSKYEVTKDYNNDTLELNLKIDVIHFNRISVEQYSIDALNFTFESIPPLGPENRLLKQVPPAT
jgi:hypothetical protein